MKPWSTRGLTAGERGLAHETFGDQIDCDPVRIWAALLPAPFKGRPFVPGRLLWPGRELVVWPGAAIDFSSPDVPLFVQSVFIHEMTHVWQSQRGVNLLFAKLKAGDTEASYAYELGETCVWGGLNIEQQAMIVQHDFLRRRGRPCAYPAEAYLAVLPFTREGDDRRRA